MKALGISPDEQKACWLILAAIYHLGAAGATKGNLPWAPTFWLVAQETFGGPSHSQFVLAQQTHLLSDTPLSLCLFQPPTSEQKAPDTRRSISASVGQSLDLGGSARELCESRGPGGLEAEGEEKGPDSEQPPE